MTKHVIDYCYFARKNIIYLAYLSLRLACGLLTPTIFTTLSAGLLTMEMGGARSEGSSFTIYSLLLKIAEV